jgi:hypothetical protein
VSATYTKIAAALLCMSAVAFAAKKEVEEGPRYVLSVLAASDGTLWVGTEGEGLFYRSAQTLKWTRDTAFEQVAGTSVFALCEDSAGRIWAGTLDCGVCVWDGAQWNRISIEEGLPGSHVAALASDGRENVWIATDAGLCRYFEIGNSVSVYNRSNGLDFSGEITSIAITKRGDVFVGTACNGVFRARRHESWSKWTKLKTASQTINSICCREGGLTIIAANEGLEQSLDYGQKWKTIVSRNPGDPKPLAIAHGDSVDLVGFEENGVKMLSANGALKDVPGTKMGDFRITSLSSASGAVLVGTYGRGAHVLGEVKGLVDKANKGRKKSNPIRTPIRDSGIQGWNALGTASDCYYLKDA